MKFWAIQEIGASSELVCDCNDLAEKKNKNFANRIFYGTSPPSHTLIILSFAVGFGIFDPFLMKRKPDVTFAQASRHRITLKAFMLFSSHFESSNFFCLQWAKCIVGTVCTCWAHTLAAKRQRQNNQRGTNDEAQIKMAWDFSPFFQPSTCAVCCLIIINKASLLKYLYFDMWRDYYIKADYNNL